MSPRKKSDVPAQDQINADADRFLETIGGTSNDVAAGDTAAAAVERAREWALAAAAVEPAPDEPTPEPAPAEPAPTSMPAPDGGVKKDIPVDPQVNPLSENPA